MYVIWVCENCLYVSDLAINLPQRSDVSGPAGQSSNATNEPYRYHCDHTAKKSEILLKTQLESKPLESRFEIKLISE